MRSTDFYDLVSGRRRGLRAMAFRAALAAAEGPYRLGVWWRNHRYDTVESLVTRVEVPVVSVGNLTLGGTGKTPMVKWVARRLRSEGVRVALASRGYGADDGGPNDEALELERSLPDVPHVQDRDRIAASRIAIDELGTQAIVLDDGFQHRRLGRDLDIVLIDATEPFGFGRVFPRGALREPMSSLRRADAVCLTRSDLVDADRREEIQQRVADAAPDATWCESVTRPLGLAGVGEGGEWFQEPVGALQGARVAAFCGVGNPGAFRATLQSMGAEIASLTEFADHHAYTRADVDRVAEKAAADRAEIVVCTQKDLVKIGEGSLGDRPLRAVEIEASLTLGREALEVRLRELARRARQREDLEWE